MCRGSMITIMSEVYVVLGIDANEHDQVIATCTNYEKAKKVCARFLATTEFYDLWIEKHSLQ